MNPMPNSSPKALAATVMTGMIALLVTSGVTTSALGHPFHSSLAEAEFNHETGRLEVALRVNPTDLETALRKRTGQRIVLEHATAEPAIRSYVAETFHVKNAAGELVETSWVGYEVSPIAAWLYFEVPLEHGLANVEIANEMLLDEVPGQVNIVSLRDRRRGRYETLTFRGQETEQEVEGQR